MSTGGDLAHRSRPLLASRLVGREREREVLAEAVAAAARERGGVLFIVGEAGIGKSRLTRETAAIAAERGLRVIRGRAVETRTPVAFRPLAEALCGAVRSSGLPVSGDLEPFRAALGRLIPEWAAHDVDLEASVVTLSEGIVRFLAAVAGDGGCMLVLEDLHWSDPESLDVVEYLADNLTGERVLCLATARVEPGNPAIALARTLAARRSARVLEPRRLTDDEVAEMVAACLGGDAVSADVIAFARKSEGVPFLVEELLAVAVTSGSLVRVGDAWRPSSTVEPVVPFTFADGVRRRLGVVGEQPRTVLHAAAVLGRRFDWRLLPAITGLDGPEVLAGLRAGIEAQLVSIDTDDGTFRFRHALTRDAVLAELLPPERATVSARALGALERSEDRLSGEDRELAAELAQQSGDRAKAAALLLDAAREAFDHGALATAEATLVRARMLTPPDAATLIPIERSLVEVLALAGKWDQAVDIGAALLQRLGSDRSAGQYRAEVHLQLARAAVAATRFADVGAHLEQARAEPVAGGEDTLIAQIDVLAAQAAIGLDRPDEAAALAERALERSTRLDQHDITCEALEITGRCARPHDLDLAERAFDRSHRLAVEHAMTVWEVRALHELGTIDLLAGRGVERLRAARERAWACGAVSTAAVLDVQIAAALAVTDDPGQAVPPARRGAELATRYHLAETLTAALSFEALAHARLGAGAEFERCERQALDANAQPRDAEIICSFARTLLAFLEEDRAGAVTRLRAAATHPGHRRGRHASGPIVGLWSLLAAVELDPSAAELASADEPVHFVGRGCAYYARAVLAGRAGDTAHALDLVALGDAALSSALWFRHYGRRLVAEAALSDGWAPPAAWLLEALAYFDGRGEDRIASACRSLLRRSGVAVPRRRGDQAVPPELRGIGITGRELEVLRLLADGLSNQEIASRLFLSPRTVERHIANMSAKTGAERRSQLVAYAARTVPSLFGG